MDIIAGRAPPPARAESYRSQGSRELARPGLSLLETLGLGIPAFTESLRNLFLDRAAGRRGRVGPGRELDDIHPAGLAGGQGRGLGPNVGPGETVARSAPQVKFRGGRNAIFLL